MAGLKAGLTAGLKAGLKAGQGRPKSRGDVGAPSLGQKIRFLVQKSSKITFSGPGDVKIEFLRSKQFI